MTQLLGKKPARRDARNLRLTSYLGDGQFWPVPPSSFSWLGRQTHPWGMMANDRYGCCTCAAAGHMIMSWVADNGMLSIPSDDSILQAYAAITGFNPQTGKPDEGAVALDVLNYWRKTGIHSSKITAFLQVTTITQIKLSVYLFGGAYLGLNLPSTVEGKIEWTDTSGAPGSWGGHAVPAIAYDEQDLTVISWGQPLRMSWDFYTKYMDEAYAILSPSFADGRVPSPNGVDIQTLLTDINTIDHANQ